ncbi:DnaJ- protein scj1 [Blastocladiella emersonii ATCC 22665]|nr:DnaJ- protein scj1 [Blastocladiella emersonii ATCC 22665]
MHLPRCSIRVPRRHALLLVVLLSVALLLLSAAGLATAGTDYYALLGVPRDANKRQISKAYKKLALKWHPDKNPGDKEAEAKFVEASHAYEVLNDPEKRRIYDAHGEEGLKQGGGQGGQGGGAGWPFHDPFDIFNQFHHGHGGGGFPFGGGFHHPGHAPERRGPTVKLPLAVTLEDFYLGAEVEVEVSKQAICHKCRGTGAKSDADIHTCPACNGRGMQIVRQMIMQGMFSTSQHACGECGATGKVVKAKCPVCSGSKVERANSQITVTIERGMEDGHQIVFEHEGDAAPDVAPGDLVYELKMRPHPVFRREGIHLHVTQQIGLADALLGFERKLTHLDGRAVTLKRTGVTQPGFIQTVENEGMPVPKATSAKGNLYVEYQVVFPDSLSSAERAALTKLFR